MSRSPTSRGSVAAAFLGGAIALLPTRALQVLAGEPWEAEILRMVGTLLLAVALLWPWAVDQGGWVRFRLRMWTTAGGIGLAIYVFGAMPLFLILAFCLFAGGALNGWMERAHLASQSLRERLEKEAQADHGK